MLISNPQTLLQARAIIGNRRRGREWGVLRESESSPTHGDERCVPVFSTFLVSIFGGMCQYIRRWGRKGGPPVHYVVVTSILVCGTFFTGVLVFYVRGCSDSLRRTVRTGTRGLHTTPCTQHPTPYTLHPTPNTLHPTPYILHPTPYTSIPKPQALHPAP